MNELLTLMFNFSFTDSESLTFYFKMLQQIRVLNDNPSTPKASPRISALKKGSKSPFRSPLSNLSNSNSPSSFNMKINSITKSTPGSGSCIKHHTRLPNSPFLVYDGESWHNEYEWIERQTSEFKERSVKITNNAPTIEPIPLVLDTELSSKTGAMTNLE